MPYANLKPVFTAADLSLAQQDLTQCSNRMPFLVNLTDIEKNRYLRLGARATPFILRALDHYRNTPAIQVPYVQLAEWENDFATLNRLETLLGQLRSLEEAINDTVIALRQECMVAALSCYKSAKNAAQQNVPGTDHIVADLSVMLPGIHQGKGKNKKEKEKEKDKEEKKEG